MTSRENFTRMLIRFIVQNLFSFQEATEFNLLPGRFNRLSHHINEATPISVLKMNAIYGANGAGKSNLVQALMLLKDIVVEGQMPIEFITQTFKLDPDSKKKDVYLGIELSKIMCPITMAKPLIKGLLSRKNYRLVD